MYTILLEDGVSVLLQEDGTNLLTETQPAGTRFYLPSTGTPALTVEPDAVWDDWSLSQRRPANIAKGASAL